MLDLSGYDFIDFGSSLGGSLNFSKKLGGRRGLGIDIDPKKVEKAQKLNYKVMCADATSVKLPRKCVKFCVMSHFLEHLPTLEKAKEAITNAINAAADFVFIQGPWFDSDEQLKALGFKFYWSDWHGHQLHFTSTMLGQILTSLGISYTIFGNYKINTSTNLDIHPLDSPTDSFEYDPKIHSEKRSIMFTFPTYKELVGVAWLSKNIRKSKIMGIKKNMAIIYNKE